MTKTLPIISFGKLESGMPMPHLLDIQLRSFEVLLRVGTDGNAADLGLERVFQEVFPVADVNGNYSLEYVKFSLGEPKYTVEECIERDMTYSASLKATLRLHINETLESGEKRPKDIIEKEVYLGELPIIAPLGTFVINGADHRSAGHLCDQRRRAGGGVAAASFTRCGVRGVDPPQRPALVQRADHPVPRLVGGVHRRHS